jgi:tetratricopeptide (TPR) repeat protein
MSRKKIIVFLFVLLTISFALFANQALLDNADSLYWTDRYEEAKELLLSNLNSNLTNKEKAETLWRLARTTLAIGDELKAEGSSDAILFATFEEGEEYANQSIASYPLSMGYVYHASNIGRWGETKGPLNSLSKAKPMRNDFITVIDEMGDTDNTISWYVLGQLYYKLPGWPISFGDLNTAISYTRKAIDTIAKENLYHGHFKALAEMLWKRDYTAKKRNSVITSIQKEWNKAKGSTLDQHAYYEGAGGPSALPFYSPVALNQMSDRQEAVMLLKYAIAKYDIWHFHSRADKRNYELIKEMLNQFGF